jgi:glycosyltransferase involved in cell wall biosynthesis
MTVHDTEVLLAAPLLSEQFMSMDLYAEDLNAAFQKLGGGPSWSGIMPDCPSPVSRIRRAWIRSFTYPRLIRWCAAANPGLLHVLDHSYAHLCRSHPRSVATCHDIAEYRLSQLTGRQFRNWRWRVEGLREARHVIAISGNTKTDLMEFLGIPEERISVVHYGVDPLFRPGDPASGKTQFPQLSGPELKILHVGSNIMRKNMPVLIEALGLLKRTGISFSFVKVGHAFPPEQMAQLKAAGLEDHLIHLGFRHTEELPAIYSLCDIFVFPSTYEGFGRPILEAQACGTPVVLADSSCLAEVGQDAALYFPAADPAQLTARLLQLADSAERQSWAAKGIANAAGFTWEAHARGVRRVYESVLAAPH